MLPRLERRVGVSFSGRGASLSADPHSYTPRTLIQLLLPAEPSMKWTGNERAVSSTMKVIAAIAAGAFALFTLAACGHKSVEDSLAAGDLAMQNSKLADAESDYQEAASSAPNDPRPHLALGNLYVFEQKPAQAQTEYLKAIELDKTDASAHSALGSAFDLQSEPGAAENQYRAAVALAPANAAYRINLGTLLQKLGKMGQAEVEL